MTSAALEIFGVSKGLVALRAYSKWEERLSRDSDNAHGFDKQDWLAAEEELKRAFRRELSISDMLRFARLIDVGCLNPTHQEIAECAYFMSQNGSSHLPDDIIWMLAEAKEAQRKFDEAFMQFEEEKKVAGNPVTPGRGPAVAPLQETPGILQAVESK